MADVALNKHELIESEIPKRDPGPDLRTINDIEQILLDWLAEPDVIIICGQWSQGAISEIVSNGRAWLTPAIYTGKFAGLRDLRVRGDHHHLHLDLGKFTHIEYSITPSVCYGWKPSFEIFLVGEHGRGNIAFSAGAPYQNNQLNLPVINSFLQKYIDHKKRYPDTVYWTVESQDRVPVSSSTKLCWYEIGNCLRDMLPEEYRNKALIDKDKPWESLDSIVKRINHHEKSNDQ